VLHTFIVVSDIIQFWQLWAWLNNYLMEVNSRVTVCVVLLYDILTKNIIVWRLIFRALLRADGKTNFKNEKEYIFQIWDICMSHDRLTKYSRATPRHLSSLMILFLQQTLRWFYLPQCCHLIRLGYIVFLMFNSLFFRSYNLKGKSFSLYYKNCFFPLARILQRTNAPVTVVALHNQDRNSELTDNTQLGNSGCHGNQSVMDSLSFMALCKVEKLDNLVTVWGETGPVRMTLCAPFSV
jgi:hypothetical protein